MSRHRRSCFHTKLFRVLLQSTHRAQNETTTIVSAALSQLTRTGDICNVGTKLRSMWMSPYFHSRIEIKLVWLHQKYVKSTWGLIGNNSPRGFFPCEDENARALVLQRVGHTSWLGFGWLVTWLSSPTCNNSVYWKNYGVFIILFYKHHINN